ncbi:hypothetical protein H6P81_010368 [Aristolochia fimbriata]|uniref:Protein kinase domain-containing protein n=1 Tax=Aristolochia fimbriata TaxID=158543 RepID=A0AAV7ENT5_ARIFI|nr:hypothetical protein H6P81_010368 [Aristolochia fimbriata]
MSLIDEDYSLRLAQDPHGNYLVQAVIELEIPEVLTLICDKLKDHFDRLSTQKYGGYVVEDLMQSCMMEVVVSNLVLCSRLGDVARDQYGNYIIQKAWKVTKGYPQLQLELLEAIEPFMRSLQHHLHGKNVYSCSHGRISELDWETRMRIALEAAKGLEYLHEHVNPPVIHRNFKSSNILLDSNFHAKVSDFGLAKLGSDKVGGHVSTRVLGTQGYVAPEYALTGHLTTKSDVYSYGVVLLELLTGRVPVDMKRAPGEGVLVSWVLPRLTDREKVVEIMDPSLEGLYSMKEVIHVAAIAAKCVQPEADYRLLMADVVESLVPPVMHHQRPTSKGHNFLKSSKAASNSTAVPAHTTSQEEHQEGSMLDNLQYYSWKQRPDTDFAANQEVVNLKVHHKANNF